MKKESVTSSVEDPFADDRRETHHKQRVKNALERPGSYVDQTLVNPMGGTAVTDVPLQGAIVPYTRVADLSDDLRLVPLEELQHQDLLIFRYDKYHSTENDADFLTLEAALLENPEDRFLTNCGGQIAMRKIENAFQKIEEGKAMHPLVAAFHKIQTNSGRSLWVLS
jgi:hypothetical protein